MVNRTKCGNSSHYSASSKGQQGKSAHPVRSLSTPPLSTAFSIESFFFFVPAAMVPLFHVGVLAVPTTNFDFQLLPRTIMDVVLFHPQMGYICMGGTFSYHYESSTREAQKKWRACSFLDRYLRRRKKNGIVKDYSASPLFVLPILESIFS